MKRGALAFGIGACVIFGASYAGSILSPQIPSTRPTPSTVSIVKDLLLPRAEALDSCPLGVAVQYRVYNVIPNSQSSDNCWDLTLYCELKRTMYCDATFGPDEGGTACGCDRPDTSCAPPNQLFDFNASGSEYFCTFPEPKAEILCAPANCPDTVPPETCSCDPEQDATGCALMPIACTGNASSTGQGSNFYELPIANFGSGGFVPFKLFIFGQNSIQTHGSIGALGPRATHSFAPTLTFVPGTPNRIILWTETGAVIPFDDVGGGAWRARANRATTLSITDPQANCSGTAVASLPDGSTLTFGQVGPSPCTGARHEGRIQSIARPNGDSVQFGANAAGFISTATNRFGRVVQFAYDDIATNLGLLKSVSSPDCAISPTSPDCHVFNIEHSVTSISKVLVDAATLWDITFDSAGRLTMVRDGRGDLEHAWEYTLGNRILRECGPGGPVGTAPNLCAPNDSKLTLSYPSTGRTEINFVAADGSSKTNSWDYAAQVAGDRPRVSARTISGGCPNCGDTETRTYWPNTALVRSVQDENGFFTVFDANPGSGGLGDPTLAYEMGPLSKLTHHPKVVYRGCTADSAAGCTGGYKETFEYIDLGGPSREVLCSSRPSVTGGTDTVTDTTIFKNKGVVSGCPTDRVGTSSLPYLTRREGRSADALDGIIDQTPKKTRTTRFDWSGLDLMSIQGPYAGDTDSVPADAPKVTYDYFASATTADGCTGASGANNVGRVKTETRWVDATRTLVTHFCEYDGIGRAKKTKNPDGVVTSFEYDFRGNVTRKVVDPSGVARETCVRHDAAGNVEEIRMPLVGTERAGYKYTYNNADRLTQIDQGYFSGTSCTAALSFTSARTIAYTYDAWGNRTRTEYKTGSTVDLDESAAFNALNELAEIARPAASATRKSTFAYDPLGNLKSISDALGDFSLYGSAEDITKHNRFGKITRTRQKLSATREAVVDYTYDNALNLASVTVTNGDTLHPGTITTQFKTDDFGQIVEVVSPDSGTSWFWYDGAGRIKEMQDGRGKKFRFFYDRLGRITQKRNITADYVTGSAEITYCYDGYNSACVGDTSLDTNDRGYLTAISDKAGVVRWEYDTEGRVGSEMRWLGPPMLPQTPEFETRYVHDGRGNVVYVRQPNGLYISYGHDSANRVNRVGWNTIQEPGTRIVDAFEWYSFGGLKAYRLYAGSNTYRMELLHDASGWLTDIGLFKIFPTPMGVVQTLSYAYSDDGDITKIPKTAATPNIAHDGAARITQDRVSGGLQTIVYDDAGNRTRRTAGGVNHDSVFQSSASNRLTRVNWGTSFLDFAPDATSPDAAGNMTKRTLSSGGTSTTTLTTADDGSVSATVTASGTTNFKRDFRGLRQSKSGAGGSGTYFYDLDGNMIQWTGPEATLTCTIPLTFPPVQSTLKEIPYENYIYVGGRRIAMLKSRIRTYCGTNEFLSLTVLNVYHYFSDKLDMPRAVYQQSPSLTAVWTADFDSFANPIGTINENPDGDSVTFSQPFRLPGQFALKSPEEGGPTLSAGGLHDNQHRIYDSVVGRYLQPDPLGLDYASYRYVENKPLAATDPTGEDLHYALSGASAIVSIDGGCSANGAFSFGPGGWNPPLAVNNPLPVGPSQIILRASRPSAAPAQIQQLSPGLVQPGANWLTVQTDCCQQDAAALKAASALVGNPGNIAYQSSWWVSGWTPSEFVSHLVRAANSASCGCPPTLDLAQAP